VIERVKELYPSLEIKGLGDRLDIVVLEYREIEVEKAWADHAVSYLIAEQICTVDLTAWRRCASPGESCALRCERSRRCGKSETAEVEVVTNITRIRGFAPWRYIREIPCVSTVKSEGIGRNYRSKRLAALSRKDTSNFPST